jgi:hypothetical protein
MANFKWYGPAVLALLNGDLAFDTDSFKVMLTTSSYVPDQDVHNYRDDVTNEITGTGYTAGGLALAGVAVSYDATTNEGRVLWSDAVWSSATFSGVRNAVIYKSRGGASSADELIAYLDMVTDQSVTAAPFTLDFTTSVLKITAS